MHEISFKSRKHLCTSLERQYPRVEEGGLGKVERKKSVFKMKAESVGCAKAKAAGVCRMDNVGLCIMAELMDGLDR